MNIPIYRAKKLDSDEYIIGDLFDSKYIIAKSELNRDISEALKHIREDILTKDCISAECKNEHHLLNKMLNKLLVNERLEHIYEIDKTTLSIHFPDMIDSQGNKIFASLQEDGKGGDIVDTTIGLRQNFVTICLSSGVCVFTSDTSAIKNTPCKFILDYKHRGIKVVGIQKEQNERN